MPMGPLAGDSGNSLMTPLVVIRPILSVPVSVNQTLPSGPAVMPLGKLYLALRANSRMALKPRGSITQGPGPAEGPDCSGETEQALATSVNARKLQLTRIR